MAKSGIFRTVKGETVELSASQVKAEVMQIRGWTARQYEKEYDKIRNRIRAYEGFEQLKGEKVTPESPAAFLYKESRAMKRHGADYTPSPRTAAIRQTTSISSGKALETILKGKTKAAKKARGAFYRRAAQGVERFAGLIAKNPTAARMAQEIKDPAKLLSALKAFANEMHIKIDASGRAQDSAAIPFGMSFGSTDELAFDYSAWLE